jgi:hypothetical protein
MSINDDTTALIQQISLYAALCQKALKGHGDVYEAMRKQTYGDIRKEIKALYQYKEDAEKWREHVEQKNAVINAGMGRNPFRKEEG